MKVLIVHNRYRSATPSGENSVVDSQITHLREGGIDVIPYLRSSDEIATMSTTEKVGAALGPIRSSRGVREFAEILEDQRPDIVHVHNLYPLISPWVIRTVHKAGVPVVMTVHNFRLDCVAGTYLRAGQVCTDCTGTSFAMPAITHACYRDSRIQSSAMVISRSIHTSTWQLVDRFIALTTFHQEFLERLGVQSQNIVVRPTSVSDPGPSTEPGPDVLFVGRLGTEKGVDVLLEAWRISGSQQRGRRLHLVGDGQLRPAVDRAARNDSSIVVHGMQDAQGVGELMDMCGPVVIPSTCFEGLPLVFAEALAKGRPIIASDIGGLGGTMTEAIGWKVPPSNPVALASIFAELQDQEIQLRGSAARERFLKEFDQAVTTPALIDLYSQLKISD